MVGSSRFLFRGVSEPAFSGDKFPPLLCEVARAAFPAPLCISLPGCRDTKVCGENDK